MSKVQIEKDFRELYPGGNPGVRIREYYKTKKRQMFLLVISALVLLALSFYLDLQSSKLEKNRITRNEYGEGKKEISLELKIGKEKWIPFSFVLEEKEYTKQELDALYENAVNSLPKIIKKKNKSLGSITSDLELVSVLEEYPFALSWSSSMPQLIDEDGSIYFENINRRETVLLTAYFQYKDWEKVTEIPVTILPKSAKDYGYYLTEKIKEEEANSRKEKDFFLPDSYSSQSLQWRYPAANSTYFLAVLFCVILPFVSYQKDADIHRKIKQRREALLNAFPDFISRLILFMEAGMSVRGAMFRMLQDSSKNQRNHYLYEELTYVCRQINNGLPEKEGYELLAMRCNLPCYRKLTGLLIQHMQKGSNTIIENLRKESVKAGEEQRGRMQKKGEEMGTKLLFPMMIMLGIVMVFIMVPALFSFQM